MSKSIDALIRKPRRPQFSVILGQPTITYADEAGLPDAVDMPARGGGRLKVELGPIDMRDTTDDDMARAIIGEPTITYADAAGYPNAIDMPTGNGERLKVALGDITARPTVSSDYPENARMPLAEAKAGEAVPSIRDRLFSRIKTNSELSGANISDSDMKKLNQSIPGYALRPEIRKMYADKGGVVMFDTADMTPEEQRGAMLLIDPEWLKENNGGKI